MGGYWYKLDSCYRNKRRWICARGCAARIHTSAQIIYNERGYPKMVLNGYYFRPHNAYRNQPKMLWYCGARNKYQCPAIIRTYKGEVVVVENTHNHKS
ncbi:hypothetical protein KGM_208239 [Danaus plexippus plexippus]|uniref:FLYWCH-type domain-containing protein n=1 Tax=Danaus plexippus plexippus TaxID=278856 RepID=A0A212F305_DANPL|nr:hypothetical protein KGM_208239 [Danaus plexippus plexippus]